MLTKFRKLYTVLVPITILAVASFISFLHFLSLGLRDYTDPSVWYWMTLIGQALSGIGAPFIACLPTKISHQWFPEKERHFATAVLGMSTPIGSILGSGVTPLFVTVKLNTELLDGFNIILSTVS